MRRLNPRLLPHLRRQRFRSGRLDAVADDFFQRHHFVRRLAIARIKIGGALVLDQRGVELILQLQLARRVEMRAGGGQRGALERNPVIGVVGIVLDGLLIVRDRRVPVAGGRVSLLG